MNTMLSVYLVYVSSKLNHLDNHDPFIMPEYQRTRVTKATKLELISR